MELIPLLVVFLAGVLFVVPALALAAFVRSTTLRSEVRALRADVDRLRRLVEGERGPAAAPAPPETPPAVAVPALAVPRPALSVPPPAPPAPVAPPSRPAPDIRGPDFATTLGPKLLVGTGALAFVVFLGLFVKYAWESDWIGPAGRVLCGAVFGLGLVALGIRRLGRQYRPLGQGLAGAGLASLYLSAYAAHGFYALVSREMAGALTVAITVNAVLLAARLETRLLAALAWTGAYLTPVLLSSGEDRAGALFLYLLLLDLGALALDRWRPWPETLPLAMLGTLVLYMGWFGSFFRPERFEVAAAGMVLFTAVFVIGPRREADRPSWPAFALVMGGLGVAVLAGGAGRPEARSATLVAFSALALYARTWWRGAEVVGLGASTVAVLVWMNSFGQEGRFSDACLIALPVAALYLLSLVVRGLVRGQALGSPDLAVHLLDAALVWTVLYRALHAHHPGELGLVSLALALGYLALGLAALKERRDDRLQVRALLGLAAVFVTLAIPVQLGLHGITLAWAAEGVLLLALGLRFDSALARAGGYAVLAVDVARLFVRHLPLHPGPRFVPGLNASFGTWLGVVVALAIALGLLRRARPPRRLDRAMVPTLAIMALAALFALLTAETGETFDARARLARAAADFAAADQARRAGQLALSVLWTLFATGMLAGGLAMRSRPLFYSAYVLFALTAFKVVAVDLATLGAVYRMMSFLALALLLMAGAYLNLRFRARLQPREAGP